MTAPILAPERDAASRRGRAKGSGTTFYVVPGSQFQSASTFALQANRDYYEPWWTDTPIVIDQLAAEVSTGGGTNFRIGFYRAGTDWQPIGAPLADSGNLDSSGTGVKTYAPGTPIYVPRGLYLSVINADGAPTMRTFRGGWVSLVDTLGAAPFLDNFRVIRTYAAFPTPGTAWDTPGSATTPPMHIVVYRLKAA